MTAREPLRLMIYDRTWKHRLRVQQAGLTSSWIAGGYLYRAMGRLDAAYGAHSWQEALDWLASFSAGQPIGEIQFWGHGRWGRALIGDDVLDAKALAPAHRLHDGLARVRDLLAPPVDGEVARARWWFRTCETFGNDAGHAFAAAWTEFFRARAAGHTYVIGPWQSGLHTLAPGESPTWSTREGFPADAPNAKAAVMSGPNEPNTISFLHGAIPATW